jgi:formylglycine-generating enzyme required for sulfatase activity
MSVEIHCPNPDCGAMWSILDEDSGGLGRCKKCGTEFPLVPKTRDEAPPLSGSDLVAASQSAEPGLASLFGHYQILRTLGRGGMGVVYLALDTKLERRVALKVPHRKHAQDPGNRKRFLREARAAAKFQHPNFCPIFEIGEIDGQPYLTMAFIEGGTLASKLERGQPWDQRKAAEAVRVVALALAKAHREGIVHRDLKPSNIMIDDQGGLVIMDFGLARRFEGADPTLTAAGAVLGTPSYMPPEQAEGHSARVGPRSDVYSLGVILYELISGRRPFEGSVVRVLAMILTAEPATPSTHHPGVDPVLESICLKAMAKAIEDRYPSMEEFAQALDGFLKAPAPVAPPAPPPSTPEKTAVKPAIIPPKPDETLITSSIGMRLKLIPAGRFFMGSRDGDAQAYGDEKPGHDVRLGAFYLGETEVTQGQYRAVAGESPSHFKGSDDLPVERVSWRDAVRFCNALSQREGLSPYYRIEGEAVSVPDWKGSGYRLPTEAEWEYACRAGPGGVGAFCFGDDVGQLGRYAWYGTNSDGKTHPVGQKLANAFGLYDMHGNVLEWCWDGYARYDAKPAVDPVGPLKAALRVIRGGSWRNNPRDCRSANRNRSAPVYRLSDLGFRVARVRSGP